MSPRSIPERWSCYTPIGKPIEGTRFFAFKVPLQKIHNEKINDTKKRLDCQMVVESVPNVGLVIDLTNTLRYYKPQEFLSKGISHHKIFTEGHVVPSKDVIEKFNETVQNFLNQNGDNEKLIGVHCTHGVNRTGFLLCHYMVKILSMKPGEALKKFGEARGHCIERKNYIRALYSLDCSKVSNPDSKRTSQKCNNNLNIEHSDVESTNTNQCRDAIKDYRPQYVNVHQYTRPHSDFYYRSRHNQIRRNPYSYQSFARRFRNHQDFNRNQHVYMNPNAYNRSQDEVFYNDEQV